MQKLGSLSRPSQFHTVLRDGARLSTPGLNLSTTPSDDGVRLGLAVRARGAVERNRVKRRIRAAFREAARHSPGGDVVVRADDRVLAADFQELVTTARRALVKGTKA